MKKLKPYFIIIIIVFLSYFTLNNYSRENKNYILESVFLQETVEEVTTREYTTEEVTTEKITAEEITTREYTTEKIIIEKIASEKTTNKKVITEKNSNKKEISNNKIQNNSTNNKTETKQINLEKYYIGNKNTKKFHLPTCGNLPKQKNRITFQTFEQAINRGFSPCKKCKPN